ncbi:MAG: hypothetical protein AAF629_00355 [Chloroflexota bacterium]
MTFSKSATYISLEQAAYKYGISEKVLLDQINSGTLDGVELKTGEILVVDKKIDPSLDIKKTDFDHMRGRKISMVEARQKYNIGSSTLTRWTQAGYIAVLQENELRGRGQKKYIDEADVAYCAAVYKAKYEYYEGRITGVPIFDSAGNPYKVKYQEVAAQMRNDRLAQRS